MQKISRRSLFGGVAAAAVAAIVPRGASNPIVGWDLGADERVVVWVANPTRPAPFMVFADGEIIPFLEDFRPGLLNYARDYVMPDSWLPENPPRVRVRGEWRERTAADDLVDFGQSFETLDGERIPPEDWEAVKDWRPGVKSQSGLHLDTSTMEPT